MSIELKDEWVEKALAAYEDSLADDPFHSAKTAIRANLTAILPLIEAEVREQCAKVADNQADLLRDAVANIGDRSGTMTPQKERCELVAYLIRGGGNE